MTNETHCAGCGRRNLTPPPASAFALGSVVGVPSLSSAHIGTVEHVHPDGRIVVRLSPSWVFVAKPADLQFPADPEAVAYHDRCLRLRLDPPSVYRVEADPAPFYAPFGANP